MSNRQGRPKGAKNIKREMILVKPPRCPRCQGSEFTPYTDKYELSYEGMGLEFTKITYRPCRCKCCGLHTTHQEPTYPPVAQDSDENNLENSYPLDRNY